MSFPNRRVLTVGELTSGLRDRIEREFSDVWVEGEVSNVKIAASGHCYFTLKDAAAQIKGILFRSFLKFILKEGDAVVIRGHLGLYAPRGEYQLVVDYIEPKGLGALQAAFEALKEKLFREGLFDADRKKPIPAFPLRIGLITSPKGAVLLDMLKVFSEKALPLRIVIFPVTVQGKGAALEVAAALDRASAINIGLPPVDQIDLILLARGGGSLEDLFAFNEEAVVRAIARSAIPVISAVGHETDTTLADYVADLRAPTPSLAAGVVAERFLSLLDRFFVFRSQLSFLMERHLHDKRVRLQGERRLLISPEKKAEHFRQQIASLSIRLGQGIRAALRQSEGTWERCRQGLSHANPRDRLRLLRRDLIRQCGDLSSLGETLIVNRRHLLDVTLDRLHLVSPLNVLGRGFSIARTVPRLNVIRSAREVHPQDRIEVILHHGRLLCDVAVCKTDGPSP